jgi:hypothetical protein
LTETKIGIVHSEKTKRLIYPENKNFYPIQDWELFFLNRKISYTVISDEELGNNDFDFLDVLILPSVEVLSRGASKNLQSFLNEGKGLLILGKTGTYDGEGKKISVDFIQESVGFSYKELNTVKEISERHTLWSSSVICRNLKDIEDILILNHYQPLVVEEMNKRTKPVGEYILENDNYGEAENCGIMLSERNNGRVVWFGFQLSQILADRSQKNVVEKLIFNSIEWLSPVPIVMVRPCPDNFEVPIVISNIITDEEAISIEFLEQYYSNDIYANFFLDDKIVMSSGNVLSKFAAAGEIHLFINQEISEPQISDSLLQKLFNRLNTGSRQQYFGIKVNGFQTDLFPEKLSTSLFNFYSSTDNSIYYQTDLKTGEKYFKRLTGSINTFSIEGNDDTKSLQKLSSVYNKARKNGEILYIKLIDQTKPGMGLHDNNLFSPITEYLTKQNSWITTYSNLIDWTLKRENIIISTKAIGEDKGFEIKIANRNQADLKSISFQLIPPAGKYSPRLSNPNLHLEYSPELASFVIFVPFIRAGTQEIFNIKFDER